MQIKSLIDQLPRHPAKRYDTRRLEDVTHLVVHHSATVDGSPEAFARYHVNVHGWPGIAYHYVIDKAGQVYKCQPATAVTYHAKGMNEHGLGICMVGDFDDDQPAPRQVDALLELLRDLMAAYHVSPHNVVGHREVPGTRKSCPGTNVDMAEIRRQLGAA